MGTASICTGDNVGDCGRAGRRLSTWFAIQLLGGIALVHAREGWFVVGPGRNGVEYSVLLIAVLAAVAWDAMSTAPE